ncbi:MAG: hypothetical protein E7212_00760 [Clostridium sartagoforme]|nr:hypothetical protein [Clostridium sartagoforme]
MDFNEWGNFEDLLRACGYSNNADNDSNNSNNNSGCNDIPNGFQTLPPELVAITGEIIGNIIAGNIPFNLQNIIGNWFELVGQVILVFNAQQQYFQSGPGRYYDPKNFNVTNPFCSNNSTNSANNTSTTSSTSNSKNNDVNTSKINALEKQVAELNNELKEIKKLLQK